MKARYMVSCAAIALFGAGAGMAAADENAPAQGAAAPTQVAEAPPDSTAIQEVVVTAQRRTQTSESVPMTLQVLTGAALEQQNISTFDDLLKYTPNVTYGNNGPGQGAIFMRGLSAGFAGNQSSATVANFPNVAVYLDDQSMQFPARNLDVYMVDMERVEVLEGPQGTLFGGGAEAGAVRYITNKPNLTTVEGSAEASFGGTSGGAPNAAGNAVLNIPIIQDKLAVRLVVYDDHHGGYIDNVASEFTRSNQDLANFYFGIKPTGGLCPNHLPPGPTGCTLPNAPVANNYQLAGKDTNPVDYTGGRFSALYQVDPDWSVLISESLQEMDAEGLSVEYPVGSNFQPLQPYQVTQFEPAYDKDRYSNTAWTVNGKIDDILNLVYTGGYTDRHVSQQMDYTNYSRSVEGMYYACTGGTTGWGTGAPTCYSPTTYWQDNFSSTHLTEELRLSTPDDWPIRGIVGGYWEQFRIDDVMNFHYKTIPSCTPANLAEALAGGPPCAANVTTAPGSTANDPGERDDTTAFGEDTQRGYDQTALFASADYDILPNLTLSAGTRWFRYSEFEVGSQYATGTGCLNVPNGHCAGGLTNINAADDDVRYYGFKSRAGLTYRIDQDTLTYFTWSEGFRPGAFNRSVKAVAPDADGNPQYEKPNGYAPDSLTNYEIGIKSELFDHRLLVNLSAYDMDWNNVQFLFFNPTELGNTTFGVNGPDYNVKGLELQLVAKPVEGLTVQGSVTYNHDSQTSSPCLVGNIPGSPTFGQCITTVLQKGVGVVPFANPFGSLGSVPAFSPAWEASMRLRYDFQPVQNYHPWASVSVNYTGSMYNQPATYASGTGVLIPDTTYLRYLQPAYATADLTLGINKDNWYAQLFCQNLFNSDASTFTSSAQFIESEVPLRPRIYGLKIGASF